MTHDEVSEFTAHADVAAVRAYRSAVGLRTREVVTALRPEAWDEILGIADTAPANAAGAFARGWVDGVGYRAWQGHSRAAQLASSAIGHNACTSVKPSRSGVRRALVLASERPRRRFDGRSVFNGQG
jgi:hypothetical protein